MLGANIWGLCEKSTFLVMQLENVGTGPTLPSTPQQQTSSPYYSPESSVFHAGIYVQFLPVSHKTTHLGPIAVRLYDVHLDLKEGSARSQVRHAAGSEPANSDVRGVEGGHSCSSHTFSVDQRQQELLHQRLSARLRRESPVARESFSCAARQMTYMCVSRPEMLRRTRKSAQAKTCTICAAESHNCKFRAGCVSCSTAPKSFPPSSLSTQVETRYQAVPCAEDCCVANIQHIKEKLEKRMSLQEESRLRSLKSAYKDHMPSTAKRRFQVDLIPARVAVLCLRQKIW